jgi:hypothetical protein
MEGAEFMTDLVADIPAFVVLSAFVLPSVCSVLTAFVVL